jgi:photolyase PhrII
MRMAVRAHENAALDAALAVGASLGLPVLVYHAVSERYPYASDRHHTFILEGARDVAQDLEARGVRYVLHVEREGHRGPHLKTLGERAALVVTEQVPVPPLDAWTSSLAAALETKGVPLWTLDASCIVPMPLVAARWDRAYAFRTASKKIAGAELAEPWHEQVPTLPSGADIALPFAPVPPDTLTDQGIAALVAACRIDHGVGPVRAIRGGTRAGYERLADFLLNGGLARYARDRNDALLDGTSRLSPYLHYGHISALRVARECAQTVGPSADKFLEELLVWREVAWHFCAHVPLGALHRLDVLPLWAQDTLRAHAKDNRLVLADEVLERGLTQDALWDAAQKHLVAHGELHNNVRMTWGKAVLGWSESAEQARARLVDLNHRYALDGRDPASYGGLYWCLGLFDRAFSPELPVTGTLRPRPTSVHAQRLPPAAYAARALRPTRESPKRVAIVGAGLAGLSCARVLADHNVECVVFDKGRGVGGRTSTRRTDDGSFDLGAQYFTARDARFVRWVRMWEARGLVAPWAGTVVKLGAEGAAPQDTTACDRYVGVPGMSALAKHLAADLHVKTGHIVDQLRMDNGRVALLGRRDLHATLAPASPDALGDEHFGAFDALVVCVPPAQAAALLAVHHTAMADRLAQVAFEPCLALGIDLAEPLPVPWDAAFVGGPDETEGPSPLSWIARDSSKPGRSSGERWMLHARGHVSRQWYHRPVHELRDMLVAAFARLIATTPQVKSTHVHRWKYARPIGPPTGIVRGSLGGVSVLVGGDYTEGGRVEGAYLAGVRLAGSLLCA